MAAHTHKELSAGVQLSYNIVQTHNHAKHLFAVYKFMSRRLHLRAFNALKEHISCQRISGGV